MTWYSIVYVALLWLTSLVIVAGTAAHWHENNDTLTAAIGILAIITLAVGGEIAKWWRTYQALGKLYLKACERRRKEREHAK